MISAVTGQQFQIGAGPYRATVTGLGAGLRELLFRGQPVIAGYDADELPPGGAGQLLAPWPNRIDGGRYVFGGAEFQLALTEPEHANAIHGLTRWTAWTPVRHEAGAVVLRSSAHGQQGYPFCLEIDAEYRLHPGSGLHVAITATNRGSRAGPYGTGSHPYLTAGTPMVNDCQLTLPAAFWLPTDERGIPSRPPAAVEGTANRRYVVDCQASGIVSAGTQNWLLCLVGPVPRNPCVTSAPPATGRGCGSRDTVS